MYAKHVDTGASAKALEELKNQLKERHTPCRFTTPERLGRQVAIDVRWFPKRASTSARTRVAGKSIPRLEPPSYSEAGRAAWSLSIGAQPDRDGTRFRVWARDCDHVEVELYRDGGGGSPDIFELKPEGDGYFSAHIKKVQPGERYRYRLNQGESFPDPASRY